MCRTGREAEDNWKNRQRADGRRDGGWGWVIMDGWMWEAGLQEGMATHSSIPAWRVPQKSLEDYSSPWGCKQLDSTED